MEKEGIAKAEGMVYILIRQDCGVYVRSNPQKSSLRILSQRILIKNRNWQ